MVGFAKGIDPAHEIQDFLLAMFMTRQGFSNSYDLTQRKKFSDLKIEDVSA